MAVFCVWQLSQTAAAKTKSEHSPPCPLCLAQTLFSCCRCSQFCSSTCKSRCCLSARLRSPSSGKRRHHRRLSYPTYCQLSAHVLCLFVCCISPCLRLSSLLVST